MKNGLVPPELERRVHHPLCLFLAPDSRRRIAALSGDGSEARLAVPVEKVAERTGMTQVAKSIRTRIDQIAYLLEHVDEHVLFDGGISGI